MKKIYFQLTFLSSFLLIGIIKAQTITTIAGTGNPGYNGDNIAASIAQLNQPAGVKVDGSGNVFIADFLNHRIRKVGTNGFISTIAGTGSPSYNGDNISGTLAELNRPEALAFDNAGNIFIEDTYNHRIRRLAANGSITTVAGNGTGGYNGDNIAASIASLNYPSDGILIDPSGNIFISDSYNNRIRKVDVNGIIATIAGTGVQGYNGDNIPATSAMLYYPYALALDGAGNLYFADGRNHRIRKINTSGIITTVAGTGNAGYNGDNIQATSATLNTPQGIAFDAAENLYISDSYNNRIRKINKNTGIITTIVGTGIAGYNGDNISATVAQIQSTVAISFDAIGNLYIADLGNHRIRKISNIILPLALTNFTAQIKNGNGLLQWITDNEVNTQNFVIERSWDGISFSVIGLAKASNSAGINKYVFIDTVLKNGTTQYRLKMEDVNGKSTYSKTINIKKEAAAFSVALFPNPTGNIANLSFTSVIAGKYKIQITDITAKILMQINGVAFVGANKLALDLNDLPDGIHILTIITPEQEKAAIKFIKK